MTASIRRTVGGFLICFLFEGPGNAATPSPRQSPAAASSPQSSSTGTAISPHAPAGLGGDDPGATLIQRATTVQSAVSPSLPAIPPRIVIAPAGTVERAAQIVGVEQLPFVAIRLSDAVGAALARNTDLAVSQANRRIARYQISADEGAYNVNFGLTPSYTHSVTPANAPLSTGPNGGPITEDILGATTSFSGLFPVGGGNYALSLLGQRVTTDSAGTGYNPYYPTSANFSVTQPLLQGRDIDATRRKLRTDRIALDVDSDRALVQAQTTIANVLNAYWNLTYAWQNVAVQEAALQQAQLQAESNARRVAQQRVAASDVVEANAQVSAFQTQVSLGLQSVQQDQLQLKQLLVTDTTDPIWAANLVPVTPVDDIVAEPGLDETVTIALRNRPEVAEVTDERRSQAVQVAYARDQLKPVVNLNASIEPQGLAGVPVLPQSDYVVYDVSQQTNAINELIAVANAGLPPARQIPLLPVVNLNIPSYQNGSFGNSVSSLIRGRYPTYTVSLGLSLPIGNQTARANFDGSVEQDRSLQVQQLALISSIKADSATAVEMLRADAAVLASTRDQRQAAQAVYLSELRRRAVGRSTTFLVLQRLVALANARGSELQAQSNYSKALAYYRETTGQLLAQAGVEVRRVGAKTLDATIGPASQSRVPNP